MLLAFEQYMTCLMSSLYSFFICFQGVMYALPEREEPPFSPPYIGEFYDLTEHMAYIYITDYMLNSGLYAAWSKNVLSINITDDKVHTSYLQCSKNKLYTLKDVNKFKCHEVFFYFFIFWPTLQICQQFRTP